MVAASVFSVEMGLVLSDRRSAWWHIMLPALGVVLLLLFWPMDGIDHYLARGKGPPAMPLTGTVLGLYVIFFSGASVLDQVSSTAGHAFIHWYRYTPATPLTYLAGRLLFHFVHSLLLTLMILPFLAVAAIPSRVHIGEWLFLAAYILFSTFCLRAAAESGRKPDRPSGSSAYLSFFLLVSVWMIVSMAALPRWSPVNALMILSDPLRGDTGVVFRSGLLFLLFALIGLGIAWLRLHKAVLVEDTAAGR